jgi:hypothetical protein
LSRCICRKHYLSSTNKTRKYVIVLYGGRLGSEISADASRFLQYFQEIAAPKTPKQIAQDSRAADNYWRHYFGAKPRGATPPQTPGPKAGAGTGKQLGEPIGWIAQCN